MRPRNPTALLFALTFTLVGCGTIGGRKETLSIDSDPRALKVTIDGDEVKATPRFMEVKRKRTHIVRAIDPKTGKVLREDKKTCNIRWVTSIVGNGVMALASPPVALLGLGVDFFTGGMFDCQGAIRIVAPKENVLPGRLCHTYLVAPPEHPDAAVSRRLAAVWVAAARPKLKKCDVIVDEGDAEEAFAYINLTHRDTSALIDLRRAHANVLGTQTQADRLVIVHGDMGAKTPRVIPEIVDMHSLERKVERPIPLKGKDATELPKLSRPSWLLYSVSLVPNAVMYGPSRTIRTVTPPTGYSILSESEKTTFPKLVTFLGINTLDHPLGYGEWDLTLRFYPQMDAGSWALSYKLKNEKTGASETRTFKTTFVQGLFNGALSAYTPVGILGFAVGAGPFTGFIYEEKPRFRLITAFAYEFSWTFFAAKNVFVQLGWEEHELKARGLESQGFRIQRWADSTVSIGYYSTLAERWVRRVF